MSDDTLRMRAVVEDGYTAPLADLRKQLRNIGTNSTARSVEKDWKAVGKNVSGVANDLRLGVAGGLRAIGLTSVAAGIGVAGIGAALAATVVGVRNLAGEARNLRLFASQVGMSVQQLRELKVLGEHFGISWESAQGSLKVFSDNLNDLRRHWGAAYNQLRGMNLGDLAEDIAKAPDMKTALDRALEGIKKIQNPVLRRQVAQYLLGSDQWAIVAAETSKDLQKSIAESLKALPDGSGQAAEKFANDMMKINVQLENLKTQVIGPLLPPFERLLDLMVKVGSIGVGVFGKYAKSIGELLDAPFKLFDKLKSGKFDIAPSDLKEVWKRNQEMRPRSTDVYSSMKDRLRKQEDLTKETEKLRKTLEQTNRDGALLQKSSFSGIGSGGGVIQASWGGGGGSRSGSGMRPPAVESPPMGNAGGGIRSSRSVSGEGGIGMRPPAAGSSPADDKPTQDAAAAGGGAAWLAKQRAPFARELKDPGTRRLLGAIISAENPGAGPAVAESLMNRTMLVNQRRAKQGQEPLSLRDMILGHPSIGRGKSFYGPVRSGAINDHLAKMNNPAYAKRMNKLIDRALEGSNIIEGHTDQGSAGDPNYINGGVGININGERFNHWGYPGSAEFQKRFQAKYVAAERAQRAESADAVQHGYRNPTIDLLETARRNAAASMTHRVEGNASLRIDLNGLPEGSRVRSNADGMFQKVQINRGRPMQSVWDPS